MDGRNIKNNLVDRCYNDAVEILRKNSNPFGIFASGYSKRAKERNYLTVFGRDAGICSLGMVVSGDKELVRAAKNSLSTLVKNQAKNGQIPNFVNLDTGQVDFWYMECIDVNLWWLIAVKFFDKYAGEKAKLQKKYKKEIEKAINWLKSQEHPTFFLIRQNEASDWADIMPRQGYVLYSNSLWYLVKNLYKIENKKETRKNFNLLFDENSALGNRTKKENPRLSKIISNSKAKKKSKIYSSFVTRYNRGDEGDVYGNILAVIAKLPGLSRGGEIINYLSEKKISRPYSVKVVLDPIKESSKNWRKYMEDHEQNYPNKYHNGGIWPFVGGFWVIALKKMKFNKDAREELVKLAKTNLDHDFNEWLHGKSGRAMGKRGQSWNAAMFILAYNYLRDKKIYL